MRIYFIPTMISFIPEYMRNDGTYTDENWPSDAVSINDEEAATYWKQNPPAGKTFGVIGGMPAWVDLPPPTEAEQRSAVLSWRDMLLSDANKATDGMADAFVAGLLDEVDREKFKAYAIYKLALNKIDMQAGYPQVVDWPSAPV